MGLGSGAQGFTVWGLRLWVPLEVNWDDQEDLVSALVAGISRVTILVVGAINLLTKSLTLQVRLKDQLGVVRDVGCLLWGGSAFGFGHLIPNLTHSIHLSVVQAAYVSFSKWGP